MKFSQYLTRQPRHLQFHYSFHQTLISYLSPAKKREIPSSNAYTYLHVLPHSHKTLTLSFRITRTSSKCRTLACVCVPAIIPADGVFILASPFDDHRSSLKLRRIDFPPNLLRKIFRRLPVGAQRVGGNFTGWLVLFPRYKCRLIDRSGYALEARELVVPFGTAVWQMESTWRLCFVELMAKK